MSNQSSRPLGQSDAKKLKHKVMTSTDFIDNNGNFTLACNETAYLSDNESETDAKVYQISDTKYGDVPKDIGQFNFELNIEPKT